MTKVVVNMFENRGTQDRIQQLMAEVMAAELHLTFLASSKGKNSPMYQEALKDFGTAWYLLRQQRERREFHPDVKAS